MAQQQAEYRAQFDAEPYWTDHAFGGMPTYQLGAKYPNDFIDKVDHALRFLPRPADYLFLSLTCMFVLLLTMKLRWHYALLGALAFGFSTYLIIILGVGHNSKAHAVAYFPMVLAGIVLCYRNYKLWGAALTALAVGLELHAAHIQMTYYLFLLCVILGIAYLIDAYRKGLLKQFAISTAFIVLGALIGLGTNAGQLLSTNEYSQVSTRGPAVLENTSNEDGGLDYDYITEYSFGIGESLSLVIPNAYGGGSVDDLGENELYDYLRTEGVSGREAREITSRFYSYWGDQPILEAPPYIGITIMFLAVLALFVIRGRLKWWLLGGVMISLVLSWGKNFGLLTNFFIEFVPLYDKFRAVSSIQVILELCMPILAVFGVYRLLDGKLRLKNKHKLIFISVGVVAGTCALVAITGPVVFDFASPYDAGLREQYGVDFVAALRDNRATLLSQDAWRGLLLVVLAGALLWWATDKENVSRNYIAVLGLAMLVLFDLVGVDRRYVNDDDFITEREWENVYQPTKADEQILADQSHYRVLDLTTNPLNSARASYFHKTIGGYHGAKPKRMQLVADTYIINPGLERGPNVSVLNMLNVKYILQPSRDGGAIYPQTNPFANGPAWFVKELNSASSENEVLDTIGAMDLKQEAIGLDIEPRSFQIDSTASIELKDYQVNRLEYKTKNTNPGYAVFSEMFYPYGWKVSIDGELVQEDRVNFLLRGLTVPPGEHEIVFEFKPEVIQTAGTLALTSNILLVLLVLGAGFYTWKQTSSS